MLAAVAGLMSIGGASGSSSNPRFDATQGEGAPHGEALGLRIDAPEPGTVTLQMERSGTHTSNETVLLAIGYEVPCFESSSMRTRSRAVWRDTLETDPERDSRVLTRTFDEIEARAELGLGSVLQFASPLARKSFVLPQEGAQGRSSFEPLGKDEEAVHALEHAVPRERVDFAHVVSSGRAVRGAAWELDSSAVRALLSPLGTLALEPTRLEGPDVQVLDGPSLVPVSAAIDGPAFADDAIQGEGWCTYLGTVPGEFGDRHRVRLELEAVVDEDLASTAEALNRLGLRGGSALGQELGCVTSLKRLGTLRAQGELQWDVESNEFRRLQLEIESDVTVFVRFGLTDETIAALQTRVSGVSNLRVLAEPE